MASYPGISHRQQAAINTQIGAFLRLLSSSRTQSNLRRDAAKGLKDLCSGLLDEEVVKEGGIRISVRVLKSHREADDVNLDLLKVLLEILDTALPNRITQLTLTGGIPVLFTHLSQPPPLNQITSCKVLAKACTDPDTRLATINFGLCKLYLDLTARDLEEELIDSLLLLFDVLSVDSYWAVACFDNLALLNWIVDAFNKGSELPRYQSIISGLRNLLSSMDSLSSAIVVASHLLRCHIMPPLFRTLELLFSLTSNREIVRVLKTLLYLLGHCLSLTRRPALPRKEDDESRASGTRTVGAATPRRQAVRPPVSPASSSSGSGHVSTATFLSSKSRSGLDPAAATAESPLSPEEYEWCGAHRAILAKGPLVLLHAAETQLAQQFQKEIVQILREMIRQGHGFAVLEMIGRTQLLKLVERLRRNVRDPLGVVALNVVFCLGEVGVLDPADAMKHFVFTTDSDQLADTYKKSSGVVKKPQAVRTGWIPAGGQTKVVKQKWTPRWSIPDDDSIRVVKLLNGELPPSIKEEFVDMQLPGGLWALDTEFILASDSHLTDPLFPATTSSSFGVVDANGSDMSRTAAHSLAASRRRSVPRQRSSHGQSSLLPERPQSRIISGPPSEMWTGETVGDMTPLEKSASVDGDLSKDQMNEVGTGVGSAAPSHGRPRTERSDVTRSSSVVTSGYATPRSKSSRTYRSLSLSRRPLGGPLGAAKKTGPGSLTYDLPFTARSLTTPRLGSAICSPSVSAPPTHISWEISDRTRRRMNVLRVCNTCGRSAKTLVVCVRCRQTAYCSEDCRVKDEAKHEMICQLNPPPSLSNLPSSSLALPQSTLVSSTASKIKKPPVGAAFSASYANPTQRSAMRNRRFDPENQDGRKLPWG